MSSLYYQDLQHEQQQQQQHRQQQHQHQHQQHHYQYHPQHSHSHPHPHQEPHHPHYESQNYPSHYHYQHPDHRRYPHEPIRSHHSHRTQENAPSPDQDYDPHHSHPHQLHSNACSHRQTSPHSASSRGSRSSERERSFPYVSPYLESREALLDALAAKISLESKNYCLDSYFPPEVDRPGCGLPRQQNVIHAAWREKICQWSYNVVDHYKLPREIVSISINYFDRFMATLSTAEEDSAMGNINGNVNGNSKNKAKDTKTDGKAKSGDLALLASLGTLHLATKVHLTNHNDYDPEMGPLESQHYKIPSLLSLATLSRGQFGPDSILEMEKQLLGALEWKLHPPTLFALINMLLELIPTTREDPIEGIKKSIRDDLFEAAMYLAELSVCDVFFVEHQVPSSTIALAAICTAMDSLSSAMETSMMAGFDASHLRGSGCFSDHHRRVFLETCSDRLGLGARNSHDRALFRKTMERLLAIQKGAEDAGHLSHMEEAEVESDVNSPTNPHDEIQQRCRSNSYNPPTSPASIADMSMSTINSCIHSMAETTLGDRETASLKRGDSMANSSIPTRNESMVSSIDCQSQSVHTQKSAQGARTASIGGRDTPDCGDTSNSSCNNSNNFRYSPSPKSDDGDDDGDGFRKNRGEDPRVADFRRRVEASLVVSGSGRSDHLHGEIYYHPSGGDSGSQQGREGHFGSNSGTAMMSCSPIVALR